MNRRARGASLLLLGLLLLALQLVLRGRSSITAQVAGQLTAFALFLPAAWLCWRGLGLGRLGLALVLVLAVGFRAAAFEPGTSAPLSTDLHRYAWDARVAAHGINPYRYTPGSSVLVPLRDSTVWGGVNERTFHTIYPPGAEGAFQLARGVFGHGLRATTWLFLLAEGAAVALLIGVLHRRGDPLERVALYAWHPLAVSEIAANGHVDALAVLALAALLATWQRRRFALAGAALAGAILAKLAPILLLPALLHRRRGRFALTCVALTAVAYLPFLSVGVPKVFGSALALARRRNFGSLEPLLASVTGRPVAIALLLAALTLLVAFVALREHETVDELARTLLLLLGATLLVATLLEPWYALWLLPALVIVPAPGWLYLTGVLPLLYLNGLHDRLPGWVPAVLYLPLAGWAIWRVAAQRRLPRASLPSLPEPPRIVAIVPALNEADALPGVLEELSRQGLDEVIVVDGGSTDATAAVAKRAGARVVLEGGRGYGRACAAGAAACDADVLIFLDGDGSDDPACIPKVLAPVLTSSAALSLGARLDLEPGAMLPHQRAGNRLVAALVRLVFGLRLRDIPPLRAIRRDALDRLALREMTYGWPTEMIVKCARAGLEVAEVPVRSRKRRGGESKIAGRAWPSARAGALMLAVVIRHA